MHKNFQKQANKIKSKFCYLTLLEYNGSTKLAKFYDNEYGEFEGNYNSVLCGDKSHPERSKKSKLEKFKKTNLKKYGTEFPQQNQEIRNKTINTYLNKYGLENPMQVSAIKEKVRKTNLEKYGVENIAQNEDIKNKQKKSNLERYGVENVFQSEEVKNKIKDTNLEKYGVEHISQNKEIKNKIKQTNLEKYGVEHFLQSEYAKKNITLTNLKTYGVENPLSSKEIRDKCKETNLEKYGVENPFQSDKIQKEIETINIKKYGTRYPTQNKKIQDKIKATNLDRYGTHNVMMVKEFSQKANKNSTQTKINNGLYHNIDGYTLSEYYRNSMLSKIRSYACIQQNYKKFGDDSLEEEFYDKLQCKSRVANYWLDQIEKELGYSLIREYHVPNTRYHTDGYDPNTNTVYEFYGDFWHGNLEKFAAEEIHPIKRITYKEAYDETIERQNIISELGYNVIYIWEDDFKKNVRNNYE